MQLPTNGIGEHRVVVSDGWLDYNQHMNVAYYTLAFDLAYESYVVIGGMGAAYTRRTNNSTMVLKAHITYQQEAHAGESLRIQTRVLDCDEMFLHLYQEMYRADDLLSTQEQLLIHVSLETRRSSPFEPAVLEKWRALHVAQKSLSVPEWVGDSVGLRK